MTLEDYIIKVDEIFNCFIDRSYYIVSKSKDNRIPTKTYYLSGNMCGFTRQEANNLCETVRKSLHDIGIEAIVCWIQYKDIDKEIAKLNEAGTDKRIDDLLLKAESSALHFQPYLIRSYCKKILQWKDSRARIAFDSTTAWLKEFPWYEKIKKQFNLILNGETNNINKEILEELKEVINMINAILQNEKKD